MRRRSYRLGECYLLQAGRDDLTLHHVRRERLAVEALVMLGAWPRTRGDYETQGSERGVVALPQYADVSSRYADASVRCSG